jgi:hypothetical chaperone protein
VAQFVYGLDFGTANSAIALWNQEQVEVLPCNPAGDTRMRSVLFFPDDTREVYVGEEAIVRYVASGMRGRFIQSIKSVLSSKSFTSTTINGQKYTAEDLVALIIRHLKTKADERVGTAVNAVVLGRPAHFSLAADQDTLAEERLVLAAKLVGFEEVYLQIEPIAAAFAYEQSLATPELVLVADLGAGTSDFTLIQLSPARVHARERKADVLGTAGIDIGGDKFDAAIMWHKFVPYFGANIHYHSAGKWLHMPTYIMRSLCDWRDIPFLKNTRTWEFITQLRYTADDPEAIARLHALIEENLAFPLFQVIEQGKCHLSIHPFLYNPIGLYAVNKAVELVPYVTTILNLVETSVTEQHWSVRKQKAAVHE